MNPVCPTFLSIHSVLYPIFTARQRSWGKVMFSVVSVQRGGFPCGYYSWCIGPHCTDSLDMRPHWMGTPDPSPSTSRTWDLTGQGPPALARPQTRDLNEHGSPSSPPLVTSSGHHGRPVQTCSLLDTPPTSAYCWWLLKLGSVKVGGTYHTGMLSCCHCILSQYFCTEWPIYWFSWTQNDSYLLQDKDKFSL